MYSDAMIGHLAGMCTSFDDTGIGRSPSADSIEFFLYELHGVCDPHKQSSANEDRELSIDGTTVVHHSEGQQLGGAGSFTLKMPNSWTMSREL